MIVKQLTNLDLKKIAVFYQNDSYGKAGLEDAELALCKLGLKPVALATVKRNSVDMANAAKTMVTTLLLQALRPSNYPPATRVGVRKAS